jgi:hypothetical protein
LAINSTYAATNIGTWSVTWTTSFDSAVVRNDTIPWLATGSVSWILITANILPTLNMVISTWAINLWTLNAAGYSTWSLDIEVGTNAANWVTVSAMSGTGWLRSAANWSVINNNQLADWIAESYMFSSALNAASDSSINWFTHTAALSSEVSDNSTSHTIYNSIKPESSSWVNDVTFFVFAKIDEQTPAGIDYQDTVTLTVVWNF